MIVKRKAISLMCLVLCLSMLSAPALATSNVDAVPQDIASSDASVSPRTVMYRDYSETHYFSSREDAPDYYYITKQYVIGSEVIPFSGMIYLKQLTKLSTGEWKGEYEGTLLGYGP